MQSDGTRNSSPLESNLKSHNNVRLWCHLHFKISTLQVASYYGYSVHYHPPFLKKKILSPLLLFFLLKSNKMISILLRISAESVCYSAYSPARSGSLSLCEAPVIVGRFLLWREQKMQYEIYVSSQKQQEVSKVQFSVFTYLVCSWDVCNDDVCLCVPFGMSLQFFTEAHQSITDGHE